MRPNQANTLQTDGIPIHWGQLYDIAVWLFLGGQEKSVRGQTVDLAGIMPGDKVLDVGCGTGTLTIAAKSKAGCAGEAYGIDASPEMIDVATQKASACGVEFQVALVEAIPFPDGYFDVVLSSLMMHHLPGDGLKQRALAEMHRVLKPGGRIVIADFEPPTGPLARPLMSAVVGPDMMKSNVQAIPPMLEKAGFTEIATGRTNSRMISYVRAVASEG